MSAIHSPPDAARPQNDTRLAPYERDTVSAGRATSRGEPLYSVLTPSGWLRVTPLSDLARPLPPGVGKLWRGGRNAAEVAAMVWSGVVVSC